MFNNLYYVLMLIALLEVAQAQRPSFAGARPPGGLSQKDKYKAPQNTAVENITGVDIATRFGAESVQQAAPSVNLAYGAPQKPPVGVPLVLPISAYVPDVAPTAAAASLAPVGIANRFGGATDASSAPTFATSAASLRPIAVAPISNALPIDANGDRDYVNQLSQLPVDNQPFWFINYQAIEALRNSSRPNVGALQTRGSFFGG